VRTAGVHVIRVVIRALARPPRVRHAHARTQFRRGIPSSREGQKRESNERFSRTIITSLDLFGTCGRSRDAQTTAGARPYPPPAQAEPLWPIQVALLATIGCQVLLPDRLTAGPTWLLPALEGVLPVALVVAFPRHIREEHPRRREAAKQSASLNPSRISYI